MADVRLPALVEHPVDDTEPAALHAALQPVHSPLRLVPAGFRLRLLDGPDRGRAAVAHQGLQPRPDRLPEDTPAAVQVPRNQVLVHVHVLGDAAAVHAGEVRGAAEQRPGRHGRSHAGHHRNSDRSIFVELRKYLNMHHLNFIKLFVNIQV